MTTKRITRDMQRAIDAAPAGTNGLLIEPWTPGEVYGVAADWAQAAAPVYFLWGDGPDAEWRTRQYQVADFRHRAIDALDCELRQALIASGEDEDDAADLLADAVTF